MEFIAIFIAFLLWWTLDDQVEEMEKKLKSLEDYLLDLEKELYETNVLKEEYTPVEETSDRQGAEL